MRIPAASGIGAAILLTVFLYLLLGGESAAKAKEIAERKLGTAYSYHVSSLHIVTNSQGKFVTGVVTAWNETEIRNVPVSWKER